MSLHTLRMITELPIKIEQAWDFFSSPVNLSVITPRELNFKILSAFNAGDKIHKGMLINYTVSPMLGIPLNWITRITEADEPEFFADEQLKGPYAYWRHEHYFKSIPEGTEMNDIVQWRVPLGILGDIANFLVVEQKVKKIFDFREKKLKELFREGM